MHLTPRERMVRSAALLMREHGVEAMSFSQVVEHSGAPRGSIYHYFPGGKAQLVEEATKWAGEFVRNRNGRAMEADGPIAALDSVEQFWRQVLDESDFRAGCVIAAATLDGVRIPSARAAANTAFRSWQDSFAEALLERDVPAERASTLATLVFAGIEGGIILARAEQSMKPLQRVLGELRAVVGAELAASQR
jgi:TetR/AcrR family transcriptional regulator, lmrAB and yxaGH operons repressor